MDSRKRFGGKTEDNYQEEAKSRCVEGKFQTNVSFRERNGVEGEMGWKEK